ncbi:3-hydroxybutyrate dehydrogenase [Salinisphaera sp. Q1T1-3]|uniref:3-hydroxybutyrate dehydrogenase n=1 Tax=Salinisphaera sp. Q1T1-3 TaxID=2321229 RepID=UPI000E7354BB|nr:3-hydroxybutyrate dehydrogenase [Salinisphaera sp. Q1T1-3]RJS93269.1 3-hydroxybutyrate dehydrogenase [Salinisphaera sp. Q1T1-3]
MTQAAHTAVVTGAASGIGHAVAEALLARGDRVLAVDRPGASLDALIAAGAAAHAVDLSESTAAADVIETAVARFGSVDILVNNAGIQHVAAIADFPLERWDTMMSLMLDTPFRLIQAAWPHMQATGWGRIVNIASIHAHVASPGKSAYVTAKHGLIGLTRTAALEGGDVGITANAVCPAYVRTPLVENQIADQARLNGMPEEAVIEQIMLSQAAVKRLIEPSEVAGVVAYLASDAASAVTGAAWDIDLGWTAR